MSVSSPSPARSDSGQFVRFVLAAGASVPVNLGARVLLSRWVPYEVALLLSHVVGMLTAWTLTRLFVFDASGRSAGSELARFAIVNVVSVAVTWCVSVGLVRHVFPTLQFAWHPELVAHLIGLGVASVTSFIGHKRFSFRGAD
jgi:putative flippase GtrA